jgi:LysR family transcriptional activator of nhaA
MRIELGDRSVWVNYHHLYCFYVVVTEGGLSRAAQKLGIGQSALSIQMKQLEASLGFGLFERAHRSIIPNERGKLVYSYAREIFRLGGEMMETLLDRPTANRTQLEVGSLDTIPKHFTSELVAQALGRHNCTVKVLEGKPDSLVQAVMEHRMDLMLSNFVPAVDPGRIQAKLIARLPLWVVGTKRFVKFQKGFPISIHEQPFIVPTGDSGVRQAFESFCQGREIRTEQLVEAQDLMVQKLLALRGLGMTVVPEMAIQEYLDQKDLFLIGRLEGLYEELYLISAIRKVHNPVAKSLMREFKLKSA